VNEHNRAIRMCQRVLEQASKNVGTQEIAYNQHIKHPDGPALRKAVELLEPLIEPEETTDSER